MLQPSRDWRQGGLAGVGGGGRASSWRQKDEELGGDRRGGNGWSVKKLKVILKKEKKTRNRHLKIKIILNKTVSLCIFCRRPCCTRVAVRVCSSRDPRGSSRWSYPLRV